MCGQLRDVRTCPAGGGDDRRPDAARTVGCCGNVAAVERKMHLIMMAGSTLEGSRRHAAMLEDAEEHGNAVDLLNRLADLSKQWPAAVKGV